MDTEQIREVNYKEYKLVDKREYTYYGLRVGIVDGSSYSKEYAKRKHKYSEKWEEVESLMMLYIISYNVMRQFMKWLRGKKEWKIIGKERGKVHF